MQFKIKAENKAPAEIHIEIASLDPHLPTWSITHYFIVSFLVVFLCEPEEPWQLEWMFENWIESLLVTRNDFCLTIFNATICVSTLFRLVYLIWIALQA